MSVTSSEFYTYTSLNLKTQKCEFDEVGLWGKQQKA